MRNVLVCHGLCDMHQWHIPLWDHVQHDLPEWNVC